MKTPENQMFAGVFRGYNMETLTKNGLKTHKRIDISRNLSRAETLEALKRIQIPKAMESPKSLTDWKTHS